MSQADDKGRDRGQLGTLSADEVRERLWAYEDFGAAEAHAPFNITGSFTSLGFLWAALRRTKRFWIACAVGAMIISAGVYAKFPIAYAANVSVLVKPDPGVDAISAMATQVQVAQSESVASRTVKSLSLTESVSDFRAAYTATATTNQIMQISLHAPTGSDAVDRANAVAKNYLQFRADLLRAQLAQDTAAYAQQVPQAQQQIASLQAQIDKLKGQSGQAANVAKLQAQLKTATTNLPTLESTVTGLAAEDRATTSDMINGSQVLDAAVLQHHSTLKGLIQYLLIGLLAGLVIGIGIVVVRAITSDRLRRRDDIVGALGAPVRLSVGRVAKRRFSLGGRSAARRELAELRVASYLRNVTRRQSDEPATLAVVAVDNATEIAPVVVALAERCAQDGQKVVVADLLPGAPVARRLGATGTGAQPVRLDGGSVVVITPEEAGRVASGPLQPAGVAGSSLLAEPPAEAVESVGKKAGLLVTVTELDPAIGAEHLSTWATEAVAVFTAGRTRAARAYAVGEMLRLSGIRAVSGVIVGTDKTDESLGSVPDDAAVLASLRKSQRTTPDSGSGDAGPGDKPGASLR
jgi:capsular polysaccharide biosynthesis protein